MVLQKIRLLALLNQESATRRDFYAERAFWKRDRDFLDKGYGVWTDGAYITIANPAITTGRYLNYTFFTGLFCIYELRATDELSDTYEWTDGRPSAACTMQCCCSCVEDVMMACESEGKNYLISVYIDTHVYIYISHTQCARCVHMVPAIMLVPAM